MCHFFSVCEVETLSPKLEKILSIPQTMGNFKFEGGGVLDDPYGVAPIGIDEKSGARITFTYDGNEKEIEGFIQWNEVLADTLTFTFNSAERPTFIAKVSQKGTVLWDIETSPENTSAEITLKH